MCCDHVFLPVISFQLYFCHCYGVLLSLRGGHRPAPPFPDGMFQRNHNNFPLEQFTKHPYRGDPERWTLVLLFFIFLLFLVLSQLRSINGYNCEEHRPTNKFVSCSHLSREYVFRLAFRSGLLNSMLAPVTDRGNTQPVNSSSSFTLGLSNLTW